MKRVGGTQRRMIVLLIRSQSGNSLINLNHSVGIGITEAFDGVLIMCQSTTNEYKLGKYSSEEKALKVLDMIEKEYKRHILGEGGPMFTRDLYVPAFAFIPPKVFKMPTDDEVEV